MVQFPCSWKQTASVCSSFCKKYLITLIIQVNHFLVYNQAVAKVISKIYCTPTLTVPVTLDEHIIGHKKFNLIATINHSCNLTKGHYTSFIKSTSSSWFHCNDAAIIIPSKEPALNMAYFFCKNESGEHEKKRGELRVSKCWSLKEFCISAHCLPAGISIICLLASVFKGTRHHWWPFRTSSEVALLVI